VRPRLSTHINQGPRPSFSLETVLAIAICILGTVASSVSRAAALQYTARLPTRRREGAMAATGTSTGALPTGTLPGPEMGSSAPPMAIPPEVLALLPHDDLGPTLLAVSWVLLSLASIFLGLRVYCKIISSRRLWWDDYVLIGSFVSRASAEFGW
jgi:hypothetical protein